MGTLIDGSFPHTFEECIDQLKQTSITFMDTWDSESPGDRDKAGEASGKAMAAFDHIVNEIFRARDKLINSQLYCGSELKELLEEKIDSAKLLSPVTREQQIELSRREQGGADLPLNGEGEGETETICMQTLLNKIKHRIPDLTNFRIEEIVESGVQQHFFLISVDGFHNQPCSIVEFIVADFYIHCSKIAPHI